MQYDWNQASVTRSEDGTETIIIPVTELKKDVEEIWEQKLYIYNLGNDSYEASLVEIYPDKKAQPDSHSIEGTNFTGIISIWDLKAGFVKSARFKDNHAVEEGIVEFLANSKYDKQSSAYLLYRMRRYWCRWWHCEWRPIKGCNYNSATISAFTSNNYIPSGSLSGGGGITAPTTTQIKQIWNPFESFEVILFFWQIIIFFY
jgi:hypothetical protein